MNNKNFVILALVFGIAFAPLEANIFTQSFEYLKKRFESLDTQKQEAVRAAGVLTVLAGITSSLLYLSKKYRQSCDLNPEIQNRIKHLPSTEQDEPATCGIHAFHNLRTAIELHKNGITLDNHGQFVDDATFKLALNKGGQGRKSYKLIVKEYREKAETKAYLQEKLKDFLISIPATDENDKKVWGQYREALDNIAKGLADYYIEMNEKKFTVTEKEINAIFRKQMANFPHLQKSENIKKFLPDLAKIKIEVDDDLITELVKKKHSTPDQWVEGDEVKELASQFHDSNDRSGIIVLDDVNQIDLYQQAIDDWRQTENGLLLFPIGTMSEQNPSGRGHWFLLIAQKLMHRPDYYTTDSLGIDRTKDRRVIKIIKKLEPEPYRFSFEKAQSKFNQKNNLTFDMKHFVQTKK